MSRHGERCVTSQRRPGEEKGWRSGESIRFSLMSPRFDSGRCHMWVGFEGAWKTALVSSLNITTLFWKSLSCQKKVLLLQRITVLKQCYLYMFSFLTSDQAQEVTWWVATVKWNCSFTYKKKETKQPRTLFPEGTFRADLLAILTQRVLALK